MLLEFSFASADNLKIGKKRSGNLCEVARLFIECTKNWLYRSRSLLLFKHYKEFLFVQNIYLPNILQKFRSFTKVQKLTVVLEAHLWYHYIHNLTMSGISKIFWSSTILPLVIKKMSLIHKDVTSSMTSILLFVFNIFLGEYILSHPFISHER